LTTDPALTLQSA